MDHSYSRSASLTCPRCGQTFTAEIWWIVDAAERPNLLERIRAGTLHAFTCPGCGRAGQVDAPLLVFSPQPSPPAPLPPRGWHFICHGDFDAQAPGNSPLTLEQRQRLRPDDLAGPGVKRRLSADRPMVFLNACQVGQSGLSLTGLSGWAARLVGECRVGALIAPLWAVTDRVAFEFARAFYGATQEPGMTLAAALRRARQQMKAAYPHNPTWLAYSLYAHPNARLVWNGVGPAGL